MTRLALLIGLILLPTLAFGQFGTLGGTAGGTGYGPMVSQSASTPGYNSAASTPTVMAPARGAGLSRGGPSNRRNTSFGGVLDNVMNDPRVLRGPNGRVDNCTPSRRRISNGGPMIFVAGR
ncbi:MAG: hypothetical protein GC160_27610 [Acidobacteria bacterium]|nr:hypothetical protein [Acidobacteriota bacterium]